MSIILKKHICLIIAVLFAVNLIGCSASNQPIETSTETEIIIEEVLELTEEATSQTEEVTEEIIKIVYRTKTGECYHRENCYYLKSSIETTLQEAETSKLRPCKICNP